MEAARGGVLFVDGRTLMAATWQGGTRQPCGSHDEADYLKTMVILAGCKTDLNAMLAGNRRARSRFTTWEFEDWSAEDALLRMQARPG